jgi:parallel beta-helix repeat protein
MRKTASILLLALLVLQPLALGSILFIGHEIHSAEGPASLAQDAGSRLEPHEYTDHVPILIDNPADWTSQGWPGSGTVGDPYIIAGLRIQYDVGVPLITIYNQDAYFVIRDCLLIQNATSYAAIEIENTTHARVEYTTAYSETVAMFFANANNTVLDHTFVENDHPFAFNILFETSYLCEIIDCELRSLGEVALILDRCNNATVEDSTLYGFDGGIWSFYSNYTLFEDLEVSSDNTGFDGIYSEDCIYTVFRRVTTVGDRAGFHGLGLHNLDISDCTITGDDYGIYLEPSDDVSISGSHMEAPQDGIGAYLVNCHYMDFSGNTITNTDDWGIWWVDGENGTITGNTLYDLSSPGIRLVNSFDIMITENTFEDIPSYGVYIDNTDNVTLMDNNYLRVGGGGVYGVYVESSDYTVIRSETMDECISAAVIALSSHNGFIEDCWIKGHPDWVMLGWFSGDNWTIQDNYVETAWKAIGHLAMAQGFKIYRNTLLDADGGWSENRLIQLTQHSDFEIINNTLSSSFEHGIFLNQGSNGLVQGNSITDTDTGIGASSITGLTLMSNFIQDPRGDFSIQVSSVTNLEVINNDVDAKSNGLEITNCPNPVVTGNIISASEYGIDCVGSPEGTFINNNITDSGFFFEEGQSFADYNHSMSGNHVNGKPLYYAMNANTLSLDGNLYGEIMLLNCSDVDITGGSFIRSTSAVRTHLCEEIHITGVVAEDLLEAFQIDRAENVSISDTQIHGMNRGTGIRGNNLLRLVIDNVTFTALALDAINLVDATNVNVSDCGFFDIFGNALDVTTGNGIRLIDCDIFNVSIGFYVSGVNNMVFNDNHVKWCQYGVYGEDASDGAEALRNDIHDNSWGIYLDDCFSWLISNNTIMWNQIGIEYFENYAPGLVYYNIIALNTINNAVDDQASFWDDGVSRGNWWDDYTPPPPYNIPGGGSATDRYPMNYNVSEPIINEPMDFSYAEFTTGNEITWIPFDDNLDYWEVEIDGVLWDTDIWNFMDITVNVDGLGYGPHDVVVTVWDVYSNSVSDTVIVTVFDDTPPTISYPSDMIIFFGVTGEEIVWQTSDQNPATYELYGDYASHIPISAGTWLGGPFTYSLDGLGVGSHSFTLIVFDVDGHNVGSTVGVTVVRDDVDPVVTAVDYLNYTEGTVGNAIIWVASDEFPSHYQVDFTHVNTTVYATGAWGGGSFLTNIDGLQAGEYTFTVTVYDMSGNMASTNVTVEVIPVGGWPEPPPMDLSLIIAALGIGGVVVIVILYLYVNKRRPAAE